jgi:hypothetical protein
VADPNPPDPRHKGGRLRLFSLIAATFFMVSGGPYGIEDTLGGAGYFGALLIIAIVPFVWSLPTTLMIGELASAMPAEGGFYVWVRRAFGPFWGYQEAWLSLAASQHPQPSRPQLGQLHRHGHPARPQRRPRRSQGPGHEPPRSPHQA